MMDDPLLSQELDDLDDVVGIQELPKTHGLLPLAGNIFGTAVLLASIPVHGALWVRAVIAGET